jgi:hypothetical protein
LFKSESINRGRSLWLLWWFHVNETNLQEALLFLGAITKVLFIKEKLAIIVFIPNIKASAVLLIHASLGTFIVVDSVIPIVSWDLPS